MRLEEALYFLHDGKLLVNGTYMTEVHVAALVTGNTQRVQVGIRQLLC